MIKPTKVHKPVKVTQDQFSNACRRAEHYLYKSNGEFTTEQMVQDILMGAIGTRLEIDKKVRIPKA